ncbi:hypothetical protein Cob_v002991 [Colletotrichum orbiculare MAFF 240422]|uniref:Uncharacterized protein n=1 Tax=Colletotrichum orbiculare (strain 104-T / ATCC 96160 / CBS 514.97 / LARS 414 / MAFF 240422) TaxID=1213857 RepID=A0A484G1T0_COLOR|nr:hypothetical protein Cob_v002991 [Colletotrichum orbiculare MAFF 240422]
MSMQVERDESELETHRLVSLRFLVLVLVLLWQTGATAMATASTSQGQEKGMERESLVRCCASVNKPVRVQLRHVKHRSSTAQHFGWTVGPSRRQQSPFHIYPDRWLPEMVSPCLQNALLRFRGYVTAPKPRPVFHESPSHKSLAYYVPVT